MFNPHFIIMFRYKVIKFKAGCQMFKLELMVCIETYGNGIIISSLELRGLFFNTCLITFPVDNQCECCSYVVKVPSFLIKLV